MSEIDRYNLAYDLIPALFRQSPAEFIAGIATSGTAFLLGLIAATTSAGHSPPRPPAGLKAKALEIAGGRITALITLPKPRELLEAYYAIAALELDGQPRYFALERARSPSGAIVGEWSENAHQDYGDAGGTDMERFIARVGELINMTD
jgi:hypothetical protein